MNLASVLKTPYKRIFENTNELESQVTEGLYIGVMEDAKNRFKNSMKVESRVESNLDSVILQRKLDNGQIQNSDLTNDELDKMIERYKEQIEKKKNKLKEFRKKLFKK